MVRSTAKEKDPNVQTELPMQSVDDIDHQLFVKWIEQIIPPELLHDFKNAGDGWTGNVEHKSLFDVWQKQRDLARSINQNTTTKSIQSINGPDSNLQVVPYVAVGICER